MSYGPKAFLGATAAMSGGLPSIKLKRRRKREPNPVVEAAAAAKRARRAAKREENARRTQAGRDLTIEDGEGVLRLGWWDCVEFDARHGYFYDGEFPWREPRWRVRSRLRRAHPDLYMRDRGLG